MTVNTKNQNLQAEYNRLRDSFYQLQKEQSEWSMKINELKQKLQVTQTTSQVVESKIGFEENAALRNRLNQLHEEYSRVLEEKNAQSISQYQNLAPRKSGIGASRVIQPVMTQGQNIVYSQYPERVSQA